MSFTDTLKRSLGFEETQDDNNKDGNPSNFTSTIQDFSDELKREFNNLMGNKEEYRPKNQSPQQEDVPTSNPMPNNAPTYDYDDYEDYDDYVIVPEQSYYEIVLIRPKSIDDVNYVVDQILDEKNPVILDLSFLERESPANFKLAGEKIKQLRTSFGAQALLLSRSEDKNLIIIAPNKVRLINKS